MKESLLISWLCSRHLILRSRSYDFRLQTAVRIDVDRRFYTSEDDRRRESQSDKSADANLLEMNITDLIDFSPIYKSIHINLFLNCKEEFSKHYQREKQKQAPVILDISPKMHESFDAFKKYLQRVTGFFIVEDHVMNTTEGLIDQRFYYDLCERATQQLLSVLRRAVVRRIKILFCFCFKLFFLTVRFFTRKTIFTFSNFLWTWLLSMGWSQKLRFVRFETIFRCDFLENLFSRKNDSNLFFRHNILIPMLCWTWKWSSFFFAPR